MSKLSDILRQVAPTLAGAIGSVVGSPLAGLALKELSEKLLGRPNGTQTEVEQAVANLPPDKLVELRKIDADFKVRMTELGFRPDELALEDRKSARERDVAFLTKGLSNKRGDILAYGAVLTLLVAILSLMFLEIPAGNREMLAGLVGALTILVKDVYSFEFGASKEGAKNSTFLRDQLTE